MDLFTAIKKRRSIRRYQSNAVPEAIIEKALEMAVLAPNSSNAQTWDFYWVKTPAKKQALVRACLSQSAARTAPELLVVVASPNKWRRVHPLLVDWVRTVGAPGMIISYYEKLFPAIYRWGFLNSIGLVKCLSLNAIGLFRPIMRGPNTRRDVQEVSIKSAALAAENFVLAITAQGYATCMMEGFDEPRIKRLLGLAGSDRVVMVISVGEEAERGTWGPQYRLPLESVVHRV